MVQESDARNDPCSTPDGVPGSEGVCPQCACGGSGNPAVGSRGALACTEKLNPAAIIMVAGFYLASLSLFADVLGFGSSEGFGWQQGAGVVLGGVLLFTGALLRVPTLLVIGLATGALTLMADWLALGDSEGFGGQQILGTIVGVGLIVVGLVVARGRARSLVT